MEIEFMDVGCGDFIHIRFLGDDDAFHNILIDSGTEKGDIYPSITKKKIHEIVSINQEIIDLWIISHIDDDHIGGILRLLKDSELLNQVDFSRTTFWFNYSIWDYDTGIRQSNLKAVTQAITLRNYLIDSAAKVYTITNELEPILFFGATFTILSPDVEAYSELLALWKDKEIKIRTREASNTKMARKNDYEIKIEDFDILKEVKDNSEENASSIAFIFELDDKKVLFPADSHASTLTDSLKKLNGGNPIKFDLVQVPHHGSRYNISNELIDLIECNDYIITANGFNKSNLPNKATLVKILAANSEKEINFYITQKNSLTENIFSVDTEHKIDLNFPTDNTKSLKFTI